MTTLLPLYDEAGNVRSITLDDGAEPIVLTPEEVSTLRFAQVEADALRSDRAGLLRKVRELEGDVIAVRRSLRGALILLHGHNVFVPDTIPQALIEHGSHRPGTTLCAVLAAARAWRTAIDTMNGIADAEQALLDAVAGIDEKEQKG